MTVDISSVQLSFEQNLIQIGYEKTGEQSWQRKHHDKVIYVLDNLMLSPEHDRIKLSGTLIMSLLWGPQNTIEIPFSTSVQAYFIKP